MSELLLTDNRDGVLVITFNRPDKKNAVNTEMWLALRETFQSAAQDNDVVCALLCGEGDNFCSGVDLASFGDVGEGEEHPFESAARAVVDFDRPLVAAAQGAAVGGGATVLFHADIVYVGESLRIAAVRLPEFDPGGPVLGGEVEFAGDLHVQGAAPPEVVDEEIELAHRLLVLLKLDADENQRHNNGKNADKFGRVLPG